jgi:hypothetical protein
MSALVASNSLTTRKDTDSVAKAKVTSRNTPRNIRLDLTEGEADFLLGLVASVGGSETNSPRKYAKRILKALRRVTGYDYTETDSLALLHGHVEFLDYGSPEATARDRFVDEFRVVRNLGLFTPDQELAARAFIHMIDTGLVENKRVSEITVAR